MGGTGEQPEKKKKGKKKHGEHGKKATGDEGKRKGGRVEKAGDERAAHGGSGRQVRQTGRRRPNTAPIPESTEGLRGLSATSPNPQPNHG